MKNKISEEEFEKMYKRAKEYYEDYLGITFGFLGANYIRGLMTRYENGERSKELYELLKGVE